MRKTLTYSGFVIATLFVVFAFVTATNYTQLAGAIILYPLLAYFAFKLFPLRFWKSPVITVKLPAIKSAEKVEEHALKSTETAAITTAKVGIADIDRRAFLKLIGAAGASLFIYSILFKRAESSFFGKASGPETVSLKDSSDRKIDPAERQPTDGYRISEIDDNIISYYGFVNKDGAWFIMKEDTDSGSFRYVKGDFNFAAGWGSREKLNYSYYNDTF